MVKERSKRNVVVAEPDSVLAELDMPVVHAQLANSLIVAVEHLKQAHPQLGASIGLQRLEDLTVSFSLSCSGLESRFYQMRLVSPDASNVNLMRFNPADGSAIPCEEFEQLVVGALQAGLRHTVIPAYHLMVREPVKPTHQPVHTLQ